MEKTHEYDDGIEAKILKLAKSFIEKGWLQCTRGLQYSASGPLKERPYNILTDSTYSMGSHGVGTVCHPCADDAEKWTIQGALERAGTVHDVSWFGPTGLSIPFFNIVRVIWATTPECTKYARGYEDWNNLSSTTKENVLGLFDRAIEHFESKKEGFKEEKVVRFNAKMARELANEVAQKQKAEKEKIFNQKVEQILSTIKDTANQGLFNATVLPEVMVAGLTSELQKLGYEVNRTDNGCYKISW